MKATTARVKTCPRCEQTMALEKFGKDSTRADGKRVYCKVCSARIVADRKAAQPDVVKAENERAYARYIEANRDKVNARRRKRRAAARAARG